MAQRLSRLVFVRDGTFGRAKLDRWKGIRFPVRGVKVRRNWMSWKWLGGRERLGPGPVGEGRRPHVSRLLAFEFELAGYDQSDLPFSAEGFGVLDDLLAC